MLSKVSLTKQSFGQGQTTPPSSHPAPGLHARADTSGGYPLPTTESFGAPDFNLSPRRPRWQRRAACRTEDTGTFFGRSVKRAKELCAVCPVRSECLDYAMDAERGDRLDLRHGVFGGLSPGERWELDRVSRDEGDRETA